MIRVNMLHTSGYLGYMVNDMTYEEATHVEVTYVPKESYDHRP